MCAGTACWSTVIVTPGFVFEPVLWQITTLCDGVVPVTPVTEPVPTAFPPGFLVAWTALAAAKPAAPSKTAPTSAATRCRIDCPTFSPARERSACSLALTPLGGKTGAVLAQ